MNEDAPAVPPVAAAPGEPPAATEPAPALQDEAPAEPERWVGDPYRYAILDVEAKGGQAELDVGEFAGSIEKVTLEGKDDAPLEFTATEAGVGVAHLTVKVKDGSQRVKVWITAD